MSVYVHVWVSVCLPVCVHLCLCLGVFVCVYVCAYICVCMWVYGYVWVSCSCVCACACVCVCLSLCVLACVCMCECLYVCMCVYVCVMVHHYFVNTYIGEIFEKIWIWYIQWCSSDGYQKVWNQIMWLDYVTFLHYFIGMEVVTWDLQHITFHTVQQLTPCWSVQLVFVRQFVCFKSFQMHNRCVCSNIWTKSYKE